MGFLPKLLQGIAFVPAIVHGVEAIFGSKSGEEKKNAALSFVGSAINMTDAIANQHVADAKKFQEGLSRVIDGVVECLNASVWAK